MFRIKLNTIKTCGIGDKGTAIGSIIPLERGEIVLNIVPNNTPHDFILFTTKNGIIKKTKVKEYISNTQNLRGIKAMNLKDKDEVVSASLGYDTDSIILITANGYSIRFAADDIKEQGKTAGGVKGIALNEFDYIASSILCNEEDPIFILEQNGTGKLLANKTFQPQGRGGKGQKIKVNCILKAISIKSTGDLHLVHSSNDISSIKVSTIQLSTKNDTSKKLSSKIVLDIYTL